jgi:hypothetical protein
MIMYLHLFFQFFIQISSNQIDEHSRKINKKCGFYEIIYVTGVVAFDYYMKCLMKQGNIFLYSH